MDVNTPHQIICGKAVEKLWKSCGKLCKVLMEKQIKNLHVRAGSVQAILRDGDDDDESVLGIGTTTGHGPRARVVVASDFDFVSDSDSDRARVARSGVSP
jgi:predicted nucleic acid-binding Zn ribbon protein